MGLACGTLCARDKEKLNSENAELAEFAFYQHLEETRSQGSYRRTASLFGVTELDNVVNSAANYWINKKQYKQSGNNRPMFEYNISNRCQFMKIDNSIFTAQEKICAIKIQRWWRRKKEKMKKVKRHSKSYMNIFYR